LVGAEDEAAGAVDGVGDEAVVMDGGGGTGATEAGNAIDDVGCGGATVVAAASDRSFTATTPPITPVAVMAPMTSNAINRMLLLLFVGDGG
jgi:hypothetical protein